MGMTCDLYLLSASEYEKAQADDAFVDQWLEERSWWDEDSKLDKERCDSLDKTWHVVHYSLTGRTTWSDSSPLAFIVSGGTEVGGDQGYGSPRLFAPADVRTISSALKNLRKEDCVKRLKHVPDDVYLRSMLDRAGALDEIWDRLSRVRALLESDLQAGLLVVIS